MRTNKILSKIVRNLKQLGIPYNDIMDEEIYQEMTVAQDKIIAEIYGTKNISIILREGVTNYPLSTSTGSVKESNVNSIKSIKYPEGYVILLKSNKDFYDIINSNTSFSANTFICTVVNNQLHFYPEPTRSEESKKIELIVYENASSGVISSTTNPEIPELFDKLIELYATSQFAPLDARRMYLEEFYQELRLLSNRFKRDYELFIKPIEGLW